MRNSVRERLTFAREISMKRRIEIIAFEHERTVQHLSLSPRNLLDNCPVCQGKTQWLTTIQVARAFQVKTATVQRWLATRKVHGIRTPGGQHRICQQSLNRDTQNSDRFKPRRNEGSEEKAPRPPYCTGFVTSW
jgi:hypothetical protein